MVVWSRSKFLKLSRCSNLGNLPKDFECLNNLEELDVTGTAETQEVSGASISAQTLFLVSNGSTTLGRKASLQPKRTPVSNEEIEAILKVMLVLILGSSTADFGYFHEEMASDMNLDEAK
ncbi:hypothetical protein FNV43_RR00807 [Rhamnella rubrinervis]|uniref:Uncharacterized protein n=1 Tax=Rhamnella rubrinervis TaxID=2594499 RepID=A0A8K0MRQ6_9ROSA|nr:hypothetical protein FNV43_RR00807 [Rhamnella rubrinervis]